MYRTKQKVDIDEALYESTKDGKPHKMFNFLCSDPICRQQGIQVTGVAYHLLPSERKVTPHFRRHYKYAEHQPECEWFIDNAYYGYTGVHPDETESEARIRLELHKKKIDFIKLYDPNPKTTETLAISNESATESSSKEPSKNSNNNTAQIKRHTRNSTTVFSKVANHHYLLNKSITSLDDFKQIKLHVKGIGKTTWFKYFKPINYFQTVKEPCIFFSYIKEG